MADEQQLEQDDTGPSPELIKEAREMGWRPEAEFKGPKERWISAEEFVDKGRHVMPIVLADRDRLRKELLTRDQKIDTLQNDLKEAQTAIAQLDKHFSEANKQAVVAAKVALKDRLKKAREDDDVDAELEVQEALALLNKEPEKKTVEQPVKKQEQPVLNPEVEAWMAENPWFTSTDPEDKKKAKAFVRIGEDLREEGDSTTGRTFMDRCVKIYEEQVGGKKDNSQGKYESGNNRQSNGRGTGDSYASLPADVKNACSEFEDSMVGIKPGQYKTVEDFRKYYAKKYYEDNK